MHSYIPSLEEWLIMPAKTSVALFITIYYGANSDDPCELDS